MTDENFLRFNNGQKFSISNFKEIKEEDLKNADAETKRLFNIFAGEDHVLQASEAQSLWNKIQTAAATNKKGDNSVFDNDEMQKFLDKDKDIKSSKTNFSINSLANMISQVFAIQETQPIVQQTPTSKTLNRKSHIRLLTNLKDENGKVKYSRAEIEEVLNNLPSGIEVKGKDLYALMTLPEISVENAIKILSKVDSPEKLKVLRVLTNTNNRVDACTLFTTIKHQCN